LKRLGDGFEEIALGCVRLVVAIVESDATEEADVTEFAGAERVVLEFRIASVEEELSRQFLRKHVVETELPGDGGARVRV
jgi:hypothetical protein